jgi:folate-binding protein YgfZ
VEQFVSEWTEYIRGLLDSGVAQPSAGIGSRVGTFADGVAEYRILAEGAALIDRSNRALLEIRGADRAGWLHNLTTNAVKTMSAGDGCYSFVTNIKGRILFDIEVSIRTDSIWISLEDRACAPARAHFDKYIVVEDVLISDRTSEFVRLGLAGPLAKELLIDLGMAQAESLSEYGMAEYVLGDATVVAMRHDFWGSFGLELLVPADQAVMVWKSLSESSRSHRAIPVGDQALDIKRIEAGCPIYPHEINEEYLPAETRQTDRAVSYSKGCYLGQEVVERMRSRDVVARQLVGLVVEDDALPGVDAHLKDGSGEVIGRMTSVCRSIALDRVIGLGYVKTALSDAGTRLRVDGSDSAVDVTVADLPFVQRGEH